MRIHLCISKYGLKASIPFINEVRIVRRIAKRIEKLGFAKEEEAGIELNAYYRNYKDSNHKPELIFALTPYLAMNGFRAFAEIVYFFRSLNIADLNEFVFDFDISLRYALMFSP